MYLWRWSLLKYWGVTSPNQSISLARLKNWEYLFFWNSKFFLKFTKILISSIVNHSVFHGHCSPLFYYCNFFFSTYSVRCPTSGSIGMTLTHIWFLFVAPLHRKLLASSCLGERVLWSLLLWKWFVNHFYPGILLTCF